MSQEEQVPWLAGGGGQTTGMTPMQKTTARIQQPPAEAAVRTMASDLASMAASGGAQPQSQAVAIDHPYTPEQEQHASFASGISENLGGVITFLKIAAVTALCIGILVAGYFAYLHFRPAQPISPPSPPPVAPVVTPPIEPTPASTTTPSAPISEEFDHQSYFQNAPDATADMILGGSVTSVADLQDYGGKVITLANAQSPAVRFLEINAKKPTGRGVSFRSFLQIMNLSLFTEDFINHQILFDFTFFTYRTSAGVWPGFVLKPSNAVDMASLKILEATDDFKKLFPIAPGKQAGGFKDEAISNQPVRTAVFENKNAFIYGIVKGYVVLSTSREGFMQAAAKL